MLGDVLAVVLGDVGGPQFNVPAAFEVDEFGGAVGIVEVEFLAVVECVEKEHFVFAVSQVPESVHEGVLVGGGDECIGEDDHQRAAVKLLGSEVERIGDVCGLGLGLAARGVG